MEGGGRSVFTLEVYKYGKVGCIDTHLSPFLLCRMQSYHHKEVYDVELKKDASGLGITIAGAEQHGLQGIVVTSITPRGPADCSGKMRTGDQVLTVSTGTAYTPHHTTPHHTYYTPPLHTPHYTTPHHTTPYHTTPHLTTPHCTIPHCIHTLHHTSPHHTLPHYTTPHHTSHTTPYHTNAELSHCKIPSPVGLHHLV